MTAPIQPSYTGDTDRIGSTAVPAVEQGRSWVSANPNLGAGRTVDNQGNRDVSGKLEELIGKFPATVPTTIDIGRGVFKFSANVTIPSHIKIRVLPNTLLSIDSGITLDFQGGLEADRHAFIGGSGTVTIGGNHPTIKPEWWGLAPGATGVINATALNAAASSVSVAGGTISLLGATYTVDSQFTIYDNVHLVGVPGVTHLDFSSALGLFPNKGCIWAQGPDFTVEVGDLEVFIEKGTRVIDFDASVTVTPGEVFMVYDSTDGSWHAERNEYRAGEYAEVAHIDAGDDSIVHFVNPFYDQYNQSNPNVSIYRTSLIRPSVRGLKVTSPGIDDAGLHNSCVRFERCRDVKLQDLECRGSSHAGVLLINAYNTALIDVDCYSNEVSGLTLDYGLAIANCQKMTLRGGSYIAPRHGVTTGGVDRVGCVPNRKIRVSDATIGVTHLNNSLCGWTCHANTEDLLVTDCTLDAGIAIQGVDMTIDSCHITPNATGDGVYSSIHIKQGVFNVRNNTFNLPTDPISGHYLINFRFQDPWTVGDVIVNIENNHINCGDNARPLRIINETSTQKVSVNVRNNHVKGVASAFIERRILIEAYVNVDFEEIIVEGNELDFGAIQFIATAPRYARIARNKVLDSPFAGISMTTNSTTPHASSDIHVHDNIVKRSQETGMWFIGVLGKSRILVHGNHSVDNNLDEAPAGTGSKFTSSYYLFDFEEIAFLANVGGDTAASPKQINNWRLFGQRVTAYGNVQVGSQALIGGNEIVSDEIHGLELHKTGAEIVAYGGAPATGSYRKGTIIVDTDQAADSWLQIATADGLTFTNRTITDQTT